MPTGHYQRKPRVERIERQCVICRRVLAMTPGQWKQRTGRYCSKQCAAKKVVKVWLPCFQCGQMTLKRRDHVRERNYCSVECRRLARRTPGSIWSDIGPKSEAAKAYFREWNKRNAEARNVAAREWARRNPEKRAAIRKAWAQANRAWGTNNMRARRAAQSSAEAATVQDWLDVLAAHGRKCAACDTTERIECDHIVPISKGGLHLKNNLQPLCRTCNASKGNKANYGIELRLTR
jgi:5-methylcytosine-specific restriction endonuclease McrA